MRYALVTFDAYAALVDFRTSLVPAITRVLGLDAHRAADFLELWRNRQLAAAGLSNALEKGRISFRECTALALDYVLHRRGLTADGDGREALIRAWDSLAPWPEADRVLAALAEKGYRLAILSNGDQDMLEALATGFETPFDHILSSEQCGLYKPHPRMYGLPARELGVERYLHVAGSPNDAMGATAAGVACYWSNRHGDRVLLPEHRPSHEGPDLGGLVDLL